MTWTENSRVRTSPYCPLLVIAASLANGKRGKGDLNILFERHPYCIDFSLIRRVTRLRVERRRWGRPSTRWEHCVTELLKVTGWQEEDSRDKMR